MRLCKAFGCLCRFIVFVKGSSFCRAGYFYHCISLFFIQPSCMEDESPGCSHSADTFKGNPVILHGFFEESLHEFQRPRYKSGWYFFGPYFKQQVFCHSLSLHVPDTFSPPFYKRGGWGDCIVIFYAIGIAENPVIPVLELSCCHTLWLKHHLACMVLRPVPVNYPSLFFKDAIGYCAGQGCEDMKLRCCHICFH